MTRTLDWGRDGSGWPNRAFSRFPDAGGYRWHIQRGGAGAKVLLLHGTGASTHSWAGLFPRLSARCDVLALDLPGHAFTRSRGPEDSSLPGMAMAVQSLLRQTGFSPEIIIGHSAGAAIAIRLAAILGARLRCIVAINGALRPLSGLAGIAGPAIARAIILSPLIVTAMARGGRDRERVARLIRSTGSEPGEPYLDIYSRLFAAPSHLRGTMRMMANWDVSEIISDLDQMGCPLVQITGDRDRAVLPEEAARLARRFPNASHIPLSGLGHLAHEEAPEKMAAAVLSAIELYFCAGAKVDA